MNTSSNRVKAGLITAAALAAFGMILPANADGMSSGKDPGSVGQANDNGGTPLGQIDNENSNGWRCNPGNSGAGVGNPAQGQCGDASSNTEPSAGPGNAGGNGGGNGSGNGGGNGSGTGQYAG